MASLDVPQDTVHFPRPWNKIGLWLPLSRFVGSLHLQGIIVVLGICAGFSILALAQINAWHASNQAKEAEAWQIHTLKVLVVAGKLEAAVNAALRGERGYLLTGDPEFLEPYRQARSQSSLFIEELTTLTSDNPLQQEHLEYLGHQLDSYLGVLDRLIELQRSGQQSAAIELVRGGVGKQAIEAVLEELEHIEAEEQLLLEKRRAAAELANLWTERWGSALGALGALFILASGSACFFGLHAHARAVQATEELSRLARTDELTGLANRREFLSRLSLEVSRAKRTRAPLTVSMIDIDHFKRFNDVFGHAAGDQVLRAISDALRSSLRETDLVGRLGGEEFAVLMPDTGEEGAELVCQRLLATIAGQKTVLPSGETVTVTVSAGIAVCDPGISGDEAMSRADAALYRSKAKGRNCITAA